MPLGAFMIFITLVIEHGVTANPALVAAVAVSFRSPRYGADQRPASAGAAGAAATSRAVISETRSSNEHAADVTRYCSVAAAERVNGSVGHESVKTKYL